MSNKGNLVMNLNISLILIIVSFCCPISVWGQSCHTQVVNNMYPTKLDFIKSQEQKTILLRNQDNIIPVKNINNKSFACLFFGDANIFTERLNSYLEMPVIEIPGNDIDKALSLMQNAEKKDQLIFALAEIPEKAGLKKEIIRFCEKNNVIVTILDSIQNLSRWKGIENINTILISDGNTDIAQDISAQIIFGGIGASGKLSIPIHDMFHVGEGFTTEGGLRLKYTIPEEEGINGERLTFKIDSIVNYAMENKAFPGCQVLMAKNGKVIFNKSYGYHTYSNITEVTNSHLYDLASVTKICGPLPLIMQLEDNGIINLDKPFSLYWNDWKKGLFHRSNKDTLTLRQLLTHQARLNPYIPFWKESIKDGEFIKRFYSNEKSEIFNLEIHDSIFLNKKFREKVYKSIRKSDLMPNVEYRYSCLSFIIYPKMIQDITGTDYEQLLYNSVYKPIGANRLVYNPLQKGYTKDEIAPTEYDQNFRKALVHGRVHDEASAILGGISGNAGLFANANDLAKLMQLYLNNGRYGGLQIISSNVINEYAKTQYQTGKNRRALGYDKPLKDNKLKNIDQAWPAPGVSESSYGHSGFTGTMVWVDPDYKIVYIFLSNRVYPTRENNGISKFNIRTSIQQVLYNEIVSNSDTNN